MKMQNKLSDLNNYLFGEMERLDDDEIMSKDPQGEIERAKAMTGVASQIVQNAKVVLDAQKFVDGKLDEDLEIPKMLG